MTAAPSSHYDLIVVGGGAAGFFGAINTAERNPSLRILILEKSTKLLSKVRVSGGGRCNVTHHCFSPAALSQHYPRGQKQLKKIFHEFQAEDTVRWFDRHGVSLKTEEDGRMFPETDRSETIIDCFLRATDKLGIEIRTSAEVTSIERNHSGFEIQTTSSHYHTRNVLVATGGYAKKDGYQWLAKLGLTIADPIPSLFTFNDSSREFTSLMGVAVPNAEVKIASTKFSERGAVLVTHWGLSGPAVIKLSAWAAEYLHSVQYTFTCLVNWAGLPEAEVRKEFNTAKQESARKKILSHALFDLPRRLWEMLVAKAEIDANKVWGEVSNKSMNKLIELITACPFNIRGKTTFKEEFVTCGGIALDQIDLNTMQCKQLPGMYIAGEVLHVDGETGGFNFQAAWSTAWVAARSIAES
ncbi:MAG: NAD(P)/FAD-dependent oxidoreductase [Bacteroidota bacterium]